LNGLVDEAQSVIGLARAHAGDGELDEVCIAIERDLWVLMAEVATAPENRHKLTPGTSLVTEEMVAEIESVIDTFEGRFDMPTEFVIPGGNVVSAQLDVARTVVRRAERGAVWFASTHPGSHVGAYLNRLSDLLWMLARWAEGSSTLSRQREGK
ncbi:MAG: cob(I)yrinic acid a,c-diamide adenosyltransferase, partial [Acidimicrobiales bacterium]